MAYLIVAVLVFAACFAVDKGFSRLFRSKAQHKSGLSVKPSKRYALFGVFLAVVGIAGVLAGLGEGIGITILSLVVLLMAAGLIAYYLSYGIYYDGDSFIVSRMGRKNLVYSFSRIRGQKLYVIQGGALLVELHMDDGSAVSIQSNMDGAYPFLDHAFTAWCHQKGLAQESCDFHDPARGQWFPDVEVN